MDFSLLPHLLPLFCGYFCGSISFASIFAKSRGIDLRQVGSGNPGATNVGRALGKKIGFLVYFFDMLKGFFPTYIYCFLYTESISYAVFAGLGSYLGHIWPLYSSFKGGKGVATLSGAMFALQLLPTLYAGVAFAFALILTRTMALGSLAFGLALPICSYFTNQEQSVFFFALFGGIFLFFTHRSNIVQLLSKGERTVLKTDD